MTRYSHLSCLFGFPGDIIEIEQTKYTVCEKHISIDSQFSAGKKKTIQLDNIFKNDKWLLTTQDEDTNIVGHENKWTANRPRRKQWTMQSPEQCLCYVWSGLEPQCYCEPLGSFLGAPGSFFHLYLFRKVSWEQALFSNNALITVHSMQQQ